MESKEGLIKMRISNDYSRLTGGLDHLDMLYKVW
jgi:hypothetical protein